MPACYHLNLPWKVHVKNKGTITYIYDASGNKLEKQATEAGHTNRTDYIGSYIYRNDTLQQIAQEEGRIRPKDSSYVYDYFIKDHLGNTRMVLTEERQQDIYPAATLESGAVSTEQNYYTINTGNIVSQPVSLTDNYPNNNGIPNPGNANAGNNSAVMYKLNAATGDKMGLGITLKVMSGDTVSIMGRSYWHSNGSSVDNNYSIPVNDLLLALTNPGSIITAKGYTYSLLEGLPVTPAALQGWLDNAPSNGSNPKAYLNWVLLDEQMKPVSGSSGFDAVGATDELRLHAQTVTVPKNGYLYVYCSNQSDQDVFFDNLQVVHTRGPLLEETHYYPFGLTMAGISSKAAGKMENRIKFNGYEKQSGEFSNGSGLEWYDYKHRFYDNQIGRFFCTDALADRFPYYTPYQFAGNEPTVAIDLDGLEPAYIASKNNKGNTKLAFPVAALYAKLYGNSRFWQAGAEANLVINQSVHDKITGYKSGAITLGHEINYTGDYANAGAEDWLKLTAHELTHVEQFDAVFGNNFKSDKEYNTAVVGWMMSYAYDAMGKMVANGTTDASKLHDKIEIEKGANKNGSTFENFFDSQNYTTKGKDGTVTNGNRVIDLLKQMHESKDDKKKYNNSFNQLMKLVADFQNK